MGNRLKTRWVGKREETGEKQRWRRERDSNPRCRYKRHTRFPVVLLQPTRTSLRIGQTKPNRAGAEPPSDAEANRSWRRGWDSNPRSRFWQDTAFRERGLQPLGHLSCPLTGTSTASSVKKVPDILFTADLSRCKLPIEHRSKSPAPKGLCLNSSADLAYESPFQLCQGKGTQPSWPRSSH